MSTQPSRHNHRPPVVLLDDTDLSTPAPALKKERVVISPPKFQTVEVELISTAPYCQNRMSAKVQNALAEKHREGDQAKKKTKKEGKNFEALFAEAQYHLPSNKQGETYGMPASAFRAAMISACRVVAYKMTLAKLALFVEADGYDTQDGTPLVRLVTAPPVMRVHPVRNATGVIDLRARPFFDHWTATLRVKFDADMFTTSDVVNLLARVGVQVGIGEGRPDSRDSAGMGWGTFAIKES